MLQRILRPLACLAPLLFLLAGCGRPDPGKQDAHDLLRDTFTNEKGYESGRLNLGLRVAVTGGQPVDVRLTGPFRASEDGQLPEVDFDLALAGGGTRYTAGLTNTGEKGFVSVQEQAYVLDPDTYRRVRDSWKQASTEEARSGGEDLSLSKLRIDARRWLVDARNAGESKVGETETVKITGKVDLVRLLEDLDEALARAGQLGAAAGGRLPSRLTDEQKRQVAESVEDVAVEIHTGADDKLLRRLRVTLRLKASGGGANSADVAFDLSFFEVNEDQEIEEPRDPRPQAELAAALGPLAQLFALPAGGTAGGSGGSGQPAAPGTAPPAGDASNPRFPEYLQCLERAGEDAAAQQECSATLGG